MSAFLFLKVLFLNVIFVTTFDNRVWKFEMELPKFVGNLLSGNSFTRQTHSGSDTSKFRLTISGPGVNALQNILQMAARKSIPRPGVEVGPGAFKSDIVTYPPNKFINDLKKLIKLKQKMDENKD